MLVIEHKPNGPEDVFNNVWFGDKLTHAMVKHLLLLAHVKIPTCEDSADFGIDLPHLDECIPAVLLWQSYIREHNGNAVFVLSVDRNSFNAIASFLQRE